VGGPKKTRKKERLATGRSPASSRKASMRGPRAVERIYGFSFPDDLYDFHDFMREHPEACETLEVRAAGPLEALAGTTNVTKEWDPRRAWPRFYNDPPEFFTVLLGHTDGLHWGYWFDAPGELPPVVASYYSNDAFEVGVDGVSLFDALLDHLEAFERDDRDYMEADPEEADHYRARLAAYAGVRDAIGERRRAKVTRKAIAPTRCGMGIVATKGQHRPLRGAKKFQVWDYEPTATEVKAYVADARAAAEGGRPATALELGHDLWIYRAFHAQSYDMLRLAYEGLGRPILADYLDGHIEFRKRCDQRRR
jgi:hypothetical protein